jgi:Mg2+ and Co2+ transporter CorA
MMKVCMSQIEHQHEIIHVKIGEMERRFLELLTRADNKLPMILAYERTYNEFLDVNVDMIEQDKTKEEMHQRVDDLCEKLAQIIESKKAEATEERKMIMESSIIENEMENLIVALHGIVQAEVIRSHNCQMIINDYYLSLEGHELPEAGESANAPVVKLAGDESVALEGAEGTGTFPKFDRMIDDAMKLMSGEETEEEKAAAAAAMAAAGKKGGKAPPPVKKDTKGGAGVKGGKKGEEIVEEKKREMTPLEKECQKAVLIEKAVTRQRLSMIHETGRRWLREYRGRAKRMYQRLDDWLFYRNKCEMEALGKLSDVLRQAIEEERKIQQEIQFDGVDLVIDYEHLNFETPPVILKPAKEMQVEKRFTLTQLYTLYHELLSYATHASKKIDAKTLLLVLARRSVRHIEEDLLVYAFV